MIWYYIITFFANFISGIFATLGIPRIETMPFGMDEPLVQAFGNFNEFKALFPPLEIVFNAFLIYMGFKITLLVLKNIPFFKIQH